MLHGFVRWLFLGQHLIEQSSHLVLICRLPSLFLTLWRAAANAADHQSLLCREVLASTPQLWLKWNEGICFTNLFLCGPSCSTELPVTDCFGFNLIQTVSLREECQTTYDNECHCCDSNECPYLFIQGVHPISS